MVLAVVVPEHWLVSFVGETLVPHRHLASFVRNKDNEQLNAGSLGPAEEMVAQPQCVFFTVV